MQNHKDSYTGSRQNIIRIRKEHIGIANFFLKSHKNLSKEIRKILKLFKAHNLTILFILQIFSFNLLIVLGHLKMASLSINFYGFIIF